MFFSLILATSISQPGILAVGACSVGLFEHGRWRSMDSMASPHYPKTDIKRSVVDRVNKGPCFTLHGDSTITEAHNSIKPFAEEGGGGGWMLKENVEHDEVTWFGPKPPRTKINVVNNNSAAYVGAVKSFLASRGIRNAKPTLNYTALPDLDANGTNEALIFFSSRPADQMTELYMGNSPHPTPGAYDGVIIRYISGGTTKIAVVSFEKSNKGLAGMESYVGAWNLDGIPGLEVVTNTEGYEMWGTTIYKFAHGTVRKVAEVGGGA